MRSFPASKLTWWICRVCNTVRAYTASDLHERRIPLCNSCQDGQVMQQIGFAQIGDHEDRLDALEIAVGALADAVREIGGRQDET